MKTERLGSQVLVRIHKKKDTMQKFHEFLRSAGKRGDLISISIHDLKKLDFIVSVDGPLEEFDHPQMLHLHHEQGHGQFTRFECGCLECSVDEFICFSEHGKTILTLTEFPDSMKGTYVN